MISKVSPDSQAQGALKGRWSEVLESDLSHERMKRLKAFILHQKKQGIDVYPDASAIFEAFHATPFESVKVVILGQDPYHGPGQAHGMSFSVPEGVPLPPSLRNIFKELTSDLGIAIRQNGCLKDWANQGVLLLNAVLTVNAHAAGSHQGRGWEEFTDSVLTQISKHKTNVVFILWGSHAQKKKHLIDLSKHLVIESVHPSPLSAYRGFFGSRPFSQTNDYLSKTRQAPIKF